MVEETPMMRQYKRIKSRYSDTILFFRLGDFYEMFHRDAQEVSRLLNLTLTKRNGVPMCGIPYHAAHSYIPRLLRAGKKIAVCEQTSNPEKGKGIVDREVVEIITPGTVTEEEYLDQDRNNYLVSIGSHSRGIALCYVDLSTGDCAVRDLPFQEQDQILREELSRLEPSEILIQESLLEEREGLSRYLQSRSKVVLNRYPDWSFDGEASYGFLKRFFDLQNLKGFGFQENDPALMACGVLFEYIQENSQHVISHIRGIRRLEDQSYIGLDEATQKNLELTKNLNDHGSSYTLLEVIDNTKTAMGARELRSRLLHPLRELEVLGRRLKLLELFYKDQILLTSIRGQLSGIRDLQRLTARLSLDKAHAKDLLAIAQSIESINDIQDSLPSSHPIVSFIEEEPGGDGEPPENISRRLSDLLQLLKESIHEEPSIYLNEGRLIKKGFKQELDDLREVKKNSKVVLDRYLQEEREKTGIANLKIKYNKIIGYFLEVSKANTDKAVSYTHLTLPTKRIV
mgnify:CR=1 FL=1